jgi:hypothetical protein
MATIPKGRDVADRKSSYCGDTRRRFFRQSAALGAALLLSQPAQSASIAETTGEVLINGARAMRDAVIKAGDRIETAAGARIAFRVGNDAFLLREMSVVVLEASPGSRAIMSGLRLLTGALLGVFGAGMKMIQTNLVAGAIRGTGIYVEAAAERSYFCTCYGDVGLSATDGAKKDVATRNHSAHYIFAGGRAGGSIVTAPMVNHDNRELAMLEKLAGRAPRLKV